MKRTGVLSALLFIALPIGAAVSENARSIALVLDASGSMKARLPSD
jgi:hypothetical protein